MFRTPLTYPNTYTWLLLVSTLDILLTYVVLTLGGVEVNPVANWLLTHLDWYGLMLLKFTIVLFFIGICEAVARHDKPKGQRLAIYGIALTCVPLISVLLQFAMSHV